MHWNAHGEVEVPDDLGWMSHAERTYLATIRFTKRRVEFLARRFTAKRAIAASLGITADQLDRIEVRHYASGAPWAALDGAPAGIEMSLTDRGGWAVCLVGGSHARGTIGIDLELVEPRSDGFVRDFLTEPEQGYVNACAPGPERDAAANLMWSAKEAALKVLQVGLRADTRTVEVAPEPSERTDGWARFTVRSVAGDVFPGWWRRDGQFVLTIATRTEIDPPARLADSADLATAEPVHSWLANPVVF